MTLEVDLGGDSAELSTGNIHRRDRREYWKLKLAESLEPSFIPFLKHDSLLNYMPIEATVKLERL